MKTHLTNRASWGTLGNFCLPVVIALIFFAFTFSYYPFREKLQFDTDEGLNLMRSMLVTRGYPMYSEVSSDQPPLFTYILALVLRVAGFEVNPARVLVLLFSTILVWAGAQFLQLTWGKPSAILFLPLAIIVPRYLELSVSVMIGVPSISLAVLSMLFVTLWHLKRNTAWLILSGFALALSVLIKLFTGFLAPIFLIGIFITGYIDRREGRFSWKIFQPVLIWSICFAGLGLLLGLALVGPKNVWLIILPPLTAPSKEIFQREIFTINNHLQAAFPLLILAIFSALVSIIQKKWLTMYPLAWSITAYSLLSFYSPAFYHHQLLITIPATIVTAAVAGDGLLSIFRIKSLPDLVRLQTVLGIGALVSFIFVFNHYVPVLRGEITNVPHLSGFTLKATPGKLEVLSTMSKYNDQTHWIMTDMPMYAFRVHQPVPPKLATFSQKRLSTGSLTVEDILTAMQEYHPEQVLIARFEIPALEEYLKENYTLILSEEFFRLFIRNDIKPITD